MSPLGNMRDFVTTLSLVYSLMALWSENIQIREESVL